MVMDASYMSTPGYDVGNRSGRIWSEQQQYMDETTIEFSGKLSFENPRPAFWKRDKVRSSCEDDL